MKVTNIQLIRIYLPLIFILLVGAFLRFYNLNWDLGYYFHPDERNIANAVSKIRFFSQLNPDFFAYGGFTIYLYRLGAELMVTLTNDQSWINDWGKINLIGRFFGALFSTLTVLPIYLLAKRIFNHLTGLISSLLFTFCVTSIQTAHYSTVENLMVLLVTLITYFSLILYHNPRVKSLLIIAVLCGIAGATKTTSLSYILIPTFTLSLLMWQKKLRYKILPIFLFIFLAVSTLVFFILSPYTIFSWQKFMESMKYESGVATGTLPVVYTYQFINTPSYIYQIHNLFWQLGPVNIIAIIGFISLLLYSLYYRKFTFLVFLFFPVIYFLYVGSWHTKFIRYMLPTIPYLIISASALLVFIFKTHKGLGTALITISLLITILFSLSFFSIYTRPQTRIAASEWIYKNIPNNSRILREHWDDGLPVLFSNSKFFYLDDLAIYDPDNNSKVNYYADKLSGADFIIINSRRLYGTLINLPDRYPVTSTYYRKLFSGDLGYQKVAEFSSYPQIFSLVINDDTSEESFQVYDHPRVMIFKNIDHMTYQDIINNLK